jgi:anaerobic magnesium-protoporphyrin IX monomethyl ester cyclase
MVQAIKSSNNPTNKQQDLHLIFPPQWTPYQPFLSTPSLKAYLEGHGFSVHQSDWNVEFYHYFIGKARLGRARKRLEKYVTTLSPDYESYRARSLYALAILADYDAQRDLVSKLHDEETLSDLRLMHRAVNAFYRLLDAFSVAEPIVEVGSSSFSAQRVLEDVRTMDAFTENRQENPFIEFFEQKIPFLGRPRYFGLSIIGTEQVIPGLTLGRLLKLHFPEIPVIIGGSVFSRLVDRTDIIAGFFGRYFDYVCRYEGELPMRAFLSASNPTTDVVPNFVFMKEGELTKRDLGPQVLMDDVPTPDFSQLPLKNYFSPQLVLPLLSTRGCYWDKCAFCYHGMVYQSRYRMRKPELIAQDVATLESRYGARHFAFNDEAIPPLLFRRMPDVIPADRYAFTALYKFEKVFTREDFARMYKIGFRSFYIGLETASERVQKHMRKDNLQSTMLSNLRSAHDAGIWNHTFVFFGFPTESEEEAEETINFLIQNADLIHSEGTGTFSFEHNAPIHKDPETFGVKAVVPKPGNIFELYYNYETVSGLDADGAGRMLERFNMLKTTSGAYQTGRWIPREHLLLLVKAFGRDGLKQRLRGLDGTESARSSVGDELKWFSFQTDTDKRMNFIVGLTKGKVYETNDDAITLLDRLTPETPVESLVRRFPNLKEIAA